MIKTLTHMLPILSIIGFAVYASETNIDTTFEKIVAGLLFLIANGLISYWTSYMQKKGDNLATKEDIQEITKITEEIRHDLELVNENKIGFQSLRRTAIVDYYERYMQWLNTLLFLQFENASIDEIKPKLEQLLSEYNNAESRLKLFDPSFTEYELLIKSITLSTMILQTNYLWKLSQFSSIDKNVHLKSPIAQDYYSLRDREYDKIKPNISDLTKKLRELMQNIR